MLLSCTGLITAKCVTSVFLKEAIIATSPVSLLLMSNYFFKGHNDQLVSMNLISLGYFRQVLYFSDNKGMIVHYPHLSPSAKVLRLAHGN